MAVENVQPAFSSRFHDALRRFDAENARDPNCEWVEGVPEPRELAYSRWLFNWVRKLDPAASEELLLAARSQHLCRWLIPRGSYPMTRPGYLRWREDLKKLHARKAAEILREVGYPEDTILRVQELNLKRNFPSDPVSRVLEDALCLLFLERQFGELAKKTSEEKLINALQKAWAKMTPTAQSLAQSLPLPTAQRELLAKALSQRRTP
jgi:hypothetical protein